jgi:tagatose-6-phosphate ketose/aldose isomerase
MSQVTLHEIHGQPELWLAIHESLRARRPELVAFLGEAWPPEHGLVLFAGAGSSAFIGESLAGIVQEETLVPARAVPTTDLVTHPRHFIQPERPLLVVSFSRSGDSPESLAAVDIVNALHPRAHHLIITCHAKGALARLEGRPRTFVLLLPEAANDKGLAMTGSVTGMMLAALLALRPERIDELAPQVIAAGQHAREILRSYAEPIERIASLGFDRAHCLGSGNMLAVAREAHLKILELSAGRVEARFDSYLGFRHGPRAGVNERSLMLYFLSSDPHVRRYELDLLRSVQSAQKPMAAIAVSEWAEPLPVDLTVALAGERRLQSGVLALPYLIVPQLLATRKSLSLGLDPDSPSESGAIHRVVQGVSIYPFVP